MVLPEFERSIEKQESGDDDEIVPMPDDGGNDRRCLDHVGDWTGKVLQNLTRETYLFFDEGIGLRNPLTRLRAAQSFIRLNSECSQYLVDWRFFEIFVGLLHQPMFVE